MSAMSAAYSPDNLNLTRAINYCLAIAVLGHLNEGLLKFPDWSAIFLPYHFVLCISAGWLLVLLADHKLFPRNQSELLQKQSTEEFYLGNNCAVHIYHCLFKNALKTFSITEFFKISI